MPIACRDIDKLSVRAQDAEAELKAERKRFHDISMCHDRELGTALAEGAEARELAKGLEASLKVRELSNHRFMRRVLPTRPTTRCCYKR